MYKLAKIDRRANSSFKKKNIYIYIILFIFIYLYINTVLVEREFVHSSSEELYISFFSTASRDLCLIGFAFKAAVFETAVSQTSVYDIYVVSIRHELSFPYTIWSLFFFFTFYLIKGEMRIFVRFSFFPSFDKSYVLFGSDSLPILLFYSLVKKYPKKRFRATF